MLLQSNDRLVVQALVNTARYLEGGSADLQLRHTVQILGRLDLQLCSNSLAAPVGQQWSELEHCSVVVVMVDSPDSEVVGSVWTSSPLGHSLFCLASTQGCH